jgi:hypothetical protein
MLGVAYHDARGPRPHRQLPADCWLRDAYYALGAFRLLGHFEEREQFLQFLLNVVSSAPKLNLAPLYRIDGKSDLDERILEDWPGFSGEGPVRVGNGAAKHQQHDVFGEMILALSPLFLDARFREQVTTPVLDLVTSLVSPDIREANRNPFATGSVRTNASPSVVPNANDRPGPIKHAESSGFLAYWAN